MKQYKARLYRPSTGAYCAFKWAARNIDDAAQKLAQMMSGWLLQEIEELDCCC